MQHQSSEDQWTQIKQIVRDKWGDFAENDFANVRHSAEDVIGLVQQKTGEAKSQIEDYLNRVAPNNKLIQNLRQIAGDYATSARENVDSVAQQASEQAKAGYEQTERVVREKPMESLAVCFGVGLLAGVIGGLLVRSKNQM